MYAITTDTGLRETVEFPHYIAWNEHTKSWYSWDEEYDQERQKEAVMVKNGEKKKYILIKDGDKYTKEEDIVPTYVKCDIDTLDIRHKGFPLAHIEKL